MIEAQRFQHLNDRSPLEKGDYVVYWMQASQRVFDNDALLFAIENANAMHKPLLVYFGIQKDYPQANRRHFRFMLDGLEEIERTLKEMNIPLLVHDSGVLEGLETLYAHMALLVVDRGYTRLERVWRSHVAEKAPCSMVQVETNVVVPVESVSNKEEYSAATLRRKIEPMISYFVDNHPMIELSTPSLNIQMPYASADIGKILDGMQFSVDASECPWMQGGQNKAHSVLETFINEYLDGYAEKRNDPALSHCSHLSPYLHFGMISVISIYNQVKAFDLPDVPVFLEELIVRRELAMNFTQFNPLYDTFEGLPEWARKSLAFHEVDRRPYRYTRDQLEKAETHDRYWNTAQKELVGLGTMHGYMRMYWGKKILEWSPSPKEAFANALYLNNTYMMDGRDPNGFAGVAWCFGKHDRPWVERPVFGNIRYMNDKGLERKFSMQKYVDRIEKELKLHGVGK